MAPGRRGGGRGRHALGLADPSAARDDRRPGLARDPAGKLDVEGESPLQTAKRELSEEIGQRAERWEEVTAFYTSPGFSDERIWLYHATELSDDPASRARLSERIEIVRWPLDRLTDAIAQCQDAKSLIGLLWLRLRT